MLSVWRNRFAPFCLIPLTALVLSASAQEPAAPAAPAASTAPERGGGNRGGGAPVTGQPAVIPDSTTEGTVSVGGQAIAYRAVAGTITVGATDPQGSTLGFDGKPLPDSGITVGADAPPTARMFYAAYFKKDAPTKTRPITFIYNGGPAFG